MEVPQKEHLFINTIELWLNSDKNSHGNSMNRIATSFLVVFGILF